MDEMVQAIVMGFGNNLEHDIIHHNLLCVRGFKLLFIRYNTDAIINYLNIKPLDFIKYRINDGQFHLKLKYLLKKIGKDNLFAFLNVLNSHISVTRSYQDSDILKKITKVLLEYDINKILYIYTDYIKYYDYHIDDLIIKYY